MKIACAYYINAAWYHLKYFIERHSKHLNPISGNLYLTWSYLAASIRGDKSRERLSKGNDVMSLIGFVVFRWWIIMTQRLDALPIDWFRIRAQKVNSVMIHGDSYLFFLQWNAFKYVVCRIATTWSRTQYTICCRKEKQKSPREKLMQMSHFVISFVWSNR